MVRPSLRGFAPPHRLSELAGKRICLLSPPTTLDRHNQSPAGFPFSVTPSLKRLTTSTGIFRLFPIAYAFRPRLRGRLTLSGLTFLRKPWAFGGRASHPSYRYSSRHKHFSYLQRPSRVRLQRRRERSPTDALLHPGASVVRLVPIIIGAGSLDR